MGVHYTVHPQWGYDSLGGCANVNGGCTTPIGGVNNSLITTIANQMMTVTVDVLCSTMNLVI